MFGHLHQNNLQIKKKSVYLELKIFGHLVQANCRAAWRR